MSLEGKKILIVDDNPDAREALEVVLQANGAECVMAEDGEQGVSKAKSELPDLIILDVQMPRKDGFQAFTELRGDGATKAIPVIMLTGVGMRLGIGFGKSEMGEFLGSEPEGYIEKPMAPPDILAAVEKVLGGD